MQITICVKNTGDCRGKEVVQVYVQAPQGKLGKPARELKAFAKTKELAPGEKQKMTLHIPVKNLASYDDSGVAGHKSCYVSEAGAYVFHVGNSVRNTKIADVDGKGAYIVKELCVTEALQEALAPTEAFERIRPGQSRRMEAISRKRRQCRSRPSGYRNGLRRICRSSLQSPETKESVFRMLQRERQIWIHLSRN